MAELINSQRDVDRVAEGAVDANGNVVEISDGDNTVTAEQAARALAAVRANGRLFVPPAHYQTASDQAYQLNSANDWIAMRFMPECDFLLDALSLYITAVATEGNITAEIYSDGTAYESHGSYNTSTTDATPTMTAADAPSPAVVTASSENGSYPGWQAFDGNVATAWRNDGAGSADETLEINMGTGNGFVANKWRMASLEADYFPKRFKLQGYNGTTWDDLHTEYASADLAKPADSTWLGWMTFANGTSYEKYRVYVVTGQRSDIVEIASVEIVASGAVTTTAPGSSLTTLGTIGSGAVADTWVRQALSTTYQTKRNIPVWLVLKGAASKDFSLSTRRVHTGQGSSHPDGCIAKYTTDGGTTWTQCLQDSVPAMLNVVLNSQANHCPKLYYGRYNGAYEYLPGGELVEIPAAGVSLDCSALTASTEYHVYLYSNSDTLTLEASATDPTTSEGIMVKTGATSRRWKGTVYPLNIISTYQGPVDVEDSRLVSNMENRVEKPFGKACPYISTTVTTCDYADYTKKIVGEGALSLTAIFALDTFVDVGLFALSGGIGRVWVAVDGAPEPNRGFAGVRLTSQFQSMLNGVKETIPAGYHTFVPYAQNSYNVTYSLVIYLYYWEIGTSQGRLSRSMMTGSIEC